MFPCGCHRQPRLNLWNNTYLYGFISEKPLSALTSTASPAPPPAAPPAPPLADHSTRCLQQRRKDRHRHRRSLSLQSLVHHCGGPKALETRHCMHTSKRFSSVWFGVVRFGWAPKADRIETDLILGSTFVGLQPGQARPDQARPETQLPDCRVQEQVNRCNICERAPREPRAPSPES